MRRILLYSHLDLPLGELSTADVFSCVRREEINGEHSLEITTTRVLEKGQRVLYKDGRDAWREYAVYGIDENHSAGRTVIGTYYCVWSLQADLQGVTVSKMPGVQTPVVARLALIDALSEQTRWTVGTVTRNTTAGASMYDMSAWQALGALVDNWGGEISVTITVQETTGAVITRAVNLLEHLGSETPNRRFDFGADLKSVKRSIPDDPLYCRISPRGRGEATEGGGYGRKIRITSVNDGKDYLEYAPMVDVAKIPDGAGGYQYPTVIIENSNCETPSELLTWAQSVLVDTLTPKVTYAVDVLQAAREGIDLQGVSLGDAVDIVDRKFRDDGLRMTGRVVAVSVDEITGRNDALEIGAITEKLASKFSNAGKAALDAVTQLEASLSTAAYIEDLVERINADINALGGYTYIVPGNGILTFDVAVADPLNPVEASRVVEIKGGTIRIASSKTDGAWNWKTVFSSGFIASDVITASNILTGTMTADRIEGGTLKIGGANNVNGVIQVYDANGNVISTLDRNGISATGAIVLVMDGFRAGSKHYSKMGTFTYYNEFGTQRTGRGLVIYSEDESKNSQLALSSYEYGVTAQGGYAPSIICAPRKLLMLGGSSTQNASYVSLDTSAVIESKSNDGTYDNSMSISITPTSLTGKAMRNNTNAPNWLTVSSSYSSNSTKITFAVNAATVTGTKSRLVSTDDYGNRLLYCYETPSPMFGDIGSGLIDDDGYCVVSIDDIFAQTANSEIAYQVFLQKCGEGDCWIAEKSINYFVVEGTPGLEFDWELKAHQTGYESTRIEEDGIEETLDATALANIEFPEMPDYMTEMEEIYSEELAS